MLDSVRAENDDDIISYIIYFLKKLSPDVKNTEAGPTISNINNFHRRPFSRGADTTLNPAVPFLNNAQIENVLSWIFTFTSLFWLFFQKSNTYDYYNVG